MENYFDCLRNFDSCGAELPSAIQNPQFAQDWNLDETLNWQNFCEDADCDGEQKVNH